MTKVMNFQTDDHWDVNLLPWLYGVMVEHQVILLTCLWWLDFIQRRHNITHNWWPCHDMTKTIYVISWHWLQAPRPHPSWQPKYLSHCYDSLVSTTGHGKVYDIHYLVRKAWETIYDKEEEIEGMRVIYVTAIDMSICSGPQHALG